jgi:hypothetical protein
MDTKTQDMLKQAYNYGWSHAIEEVNKSLQDVRHNKKLDLNEEYKEVFDTLIYSISEELKDFSKDLKDK